MITSVKIENFRGVSRGSVEGLAPISILVGPNNSGKSTVLKAIAAVEQGINPKVGREELKEPTLRFMIKAENGSSGWAHVDLQGKQFGASGDALFQVAFVEAEAVHAPGALEEAYKRIVKLDQLGEVVKSLGRAVPGLTDIRILKVGAEFVLHTFLESGPPVPAYLAGAGFKRFLKLASAAVGTPKGVVLFEEPESFQHPRYLRELVMLLHLVAREGTQIILSTHSSELIDLLLHAPGIEGQAYPAVHRLRLFDGRLRATTIDREHAIIARDELLEDLRS